MCTFGIYQYNLNRRTSLHYGQARDQVFGVFPYSFSVENQSPSRFFASVIFKLRIRLDKAFKRRRFFQNQDTSSVSFGNNVKLSPNSFENDILGPPACTYPAWQFMLIQDSFIQSSNPNLNYIIAFAKKRKKKKIPKPKWCTPVVSRSCVQPNNILII